MKNRQKSFRVILFSGIALLILTMIVACGIGRYPITPANVVKIIVSRWVHLKRSWPAQATGVVMTLRLPRIIGAVLVGCALALSGASYQGVFRNPLVAPDMLGVSSGACVGASVAILMGSNSVMIQILAFAGGMLAVFLATSIPRIIKNESMVMLVLAGIIVKGLLDSGMGLIKYVADPDTQLADITHWQLGSLSNVTWNDLATVGGPIVVATVILIVLRWRINILSLGEYEARSLGTDIKKIRGLVILCATVLTASAVSISGTIGWIGLVIPHFSRMIAGDDNRRVIPLSVVLGALFLLLIDTAARMITASELPLSILTGFIGAPVYFYLLFKQKSRLT